jgi:hypothetical protein
VKAAEAVAVMAVEGAEARVEVEAVTGVDAVVAEGATSRNRILGLQPHGHFPSGLWSRAMAYDEEQIILWVRQRSFRGFFAKHGQHFETVSFQQLGPCLSSILRHRLSGRWVSGFAQSRRLDS